MCRPDQGPPVQGAEHHLITPLSYFTYFHVQGGEASGKRVGQALAKAGILESPSFDLGDSVHLRVLARAVIRTAAGGWLPTRADMQLAVNQVFTSLCHL